MQAHADRGAAVAALNDAVTEQMRLQGLLDAALADDMADDDEIARLMGEITANQTMIDGLNGQISDKDMEIARLTTMLDGDGTDANPGLSAQVAALQKELQDLKDKIAEQEVDQAVETRKANAKLLEAAMNVATDDPDAAGTTIAPSASLPEVGTGADQMADTVTGITAKRNAAGTVTVTAASTPKIADGSGSAGSSWTEVMLSRSIDDTAEDEFAVYTDIAAPTTWPIAADFAGAGMNYVVIATGDGRCCASWCNEIGYRPGTQRQLLLSGSK